jgi:hypothetical protein
MFPNSSNFRVEFSSCLIKKWDLERKMQLSSLALISFGLGFWLILYGIIDGLGA